jgi:F0F1-type ATP synthase membrane subunit a
VSRQTAPHKEIYHVAFLLVLVKAVVEVAVMALLGQFIVGIFAWGRRGNNVVYKLFQTVASPFTWLVRKVTPRVVLDTHIPLATLMLLVFVWIFISLSLRNSCASNPAQAACARFQQAPQ